MLSDHLENVLNIPVELRNLNQWCACRIGGEYSKAPLNPVTGRLASSTDPETWGTIDEAYEMATRYPDGAIGLVLTESDPFAIVDLDDKLEKPASPEEREVFHYVVENARSYVERSVSGRGYHILVTGCKDNYRVGNIEVYSSARFMILTGDLHPEHCWPSISNGGEVLQILRGLTGDRLSRRKGAASSFAYREDVRLDSDILDQLRADNPRAFEELFLSGSLTNYRDDHSQADMALIGHLLPLCSSREQLERIFHASALGQRDKAHQPLYMDLTIGESERTLTKRRKEELALAEALMQSNLGRLPAPVPPTPSAPLPELPAGPTVAPAVSLQVYDEDASEDSLDSEVEVIDVLPGTLVGAARPWEENLTGWSEELIPNGMRNLVEWYFSLCHIPIRQYCVANAIATIAAVAGRKYVTFFRNGGLNMNICLVGASASGKTESMGSTIEPALVDAFPGRTGIPEGQIIGEDLWVSTPGKYIYGSMPASGQGFMSILKPEKNIHQPAGVIIWDELAEELITPLGQKNPPPHVLGLRSRLMKLHGVSKNTGMLQGNARSNKDLSTGSFWSPAITLLAAAPTDTFWPAVEKIPHNDGFLSRILIFERLEKAPYMDPSCIKGFDPNPYIRDLLRNIDCGVERITIKTGKMPCGVDSDVLRSVYAFHAYITDETFRLKEDPRRSHLWARVFEHSIRLSCLAAIADNPHTPVVHMHHWKWGIAVVMHCKKTLESRMKQGLGENEFVKESLAMMVKLKRALTNGHKSWSEVSRKQCIISSRELSLMHMWPKDAKIRSDVKRQLLEDGVLSHISVDVLKKLPGHSKALKPAYQIDLGLLESLVPAS